MAGCSGSSPWSVESSLVSASETRGLDPLAWSYGVSDSWKRFLWVWVTSGWNVRFTSLQNVMERWITQPTQL